MNIGLGIGIPFNRSQIWLSLFDPSKLFTAGVNGAWYDPSDINLTWRRNLLTYSEQFDNVVWDKTSFPVMITADVIAAPNGTNTVDLVVPTAASAAHAVRQTGLSVGTSTSFSVYAKSAGYDRVQLYLQNTGGFGHITFSLASGTVTNTVSGSVTVTGSITSAGNGWYLLSVAGAGATTVSTVGISPLDAGANGATLVPTYTGNGTSGIYIWGAQLEQGSTATPYQRITDGIQDYLQYQAQPVLYRDAAGTQPVTAVEQPVGLVLDKSKGLVLGPELVTNGDFSNGTTGWAGTNATISASSGELTVTAIAGAYPIVQQSIATVVGKTYSTVATVKTLGKRIGVSLQGGDAGYPTTTSTSYVTLIYKFVATSTSSTIIVFFDGTGATGEKFFVDNISIRELPGNHAFNSSGNSANFPVLSARVNLLTKTEDISAADWTKAGTVTSSTSSLLETATTGTHSCYLSPTTVAATYIYSVKLKANGRTRLAIAGTSSFGGNLGSGVFFDLGTGSYVSGATGTPSITALADGWYQVSYTWTAFAASGVLGIFLVDSGTNISYSGDVTKGMLIKEVDLRVANDALNLPAYQRVNTSTNYDTVGFKPYLRFNGVNSWLQTNSIDFTYTDKMFVSAGVRKLSDAAVGMIAETSANASGNNGAFFFSAPTSVGAGTYRWALRGTATTVADTPNSYAAPITNITTCIGNISGDSAILRVNGTQAAISTADQGTGNYGNYPLYIGARAGSSLFFNGNLHQLVIAGKQASDAEITATETFINQKTGAY